jgi:hypothetical protein
MFKCDLCNKEFEYKVFLYRHKNRKTPCKKKDSYDCNICNSNFKFECDLKRHKKTNKHMKNYNIHNGDIINGNVHNGDNITNNINNIINLTINMNPFSETDLSNIRPSLIRTIASEIYKKFLDENTERLNNRKFNLVFGCFSGLIEVFKHTNFNVAFSDNFNFKILLLFNCSKKLFEYLILEKNTKTNVFEWKQIGYDDFLGEFVYLMNLISKKINCDKFTKILNYLKKNLIDDEDMKKLLKPKIENELDIMYNKFREENNLKPREFGDDNDNIKAKMEYYHLFRKNECRFDNGFDPKIINSII